MRSWIKSIMFECLREIVKDQPMIIANRPPNSEDVYEKGTIWKFQKDIYIASNVKVDWEKK